MTCKHTSVIDRLTAWPATVGSSRAARKATGAWTDDPALCVFATPGAAAETVNSEGPEAAAVLTALAERSGDDWAATAVTGLAGRLAPIVGRWARAGVTGPDLAAAEADLMAAVVEVLAGSRPTLGPDGVVTAAWQRVYGARRTEIRRAGHRESFPVDLPSPAGSERSAVEVVVGLLSEGVRRRVLPRCHAQALAAHAAGWSTAGTARRAGVGPAAIRARRRRGITALAAANAEGGW